ncbi:MAG: hypothetical protein M0024_07535 [Nitrospiraceae bacterium]|nr:hypothetical protein [Nitrospiraceae bacterium]
MKLGILVNTDRHEDHLSGLTKAAVALGHDVIIFVMDDGTRLLSRPVIRDLCGLPGVSISFCDMNARQCGLDREGLPPSIVCGSQYNNAVMNHEADRVIVL